MKIKFNSDLERAEKLQDILITYSTGGGLGDSGDKEYKDLRKYFLENQTLTRFLPDVVKKNRDLFQFWEFIKYRFAHYAERRQFLWKEFSPLLECIERNIDKPADETISDGLKDFDEQGVHAVWTKAKERRNSDPEGAITMARTLLETICKHILDVKKVPYDKGKIDLPELYRLVSKELNLAPSQHTEDNFKKILGGITSIVNELGSLRNHLGDAHGKGKSMVRPAKRHAELAVNVAGSVALFLVQTFSKSN